MNKIRPNQEDEIRLRNLAAVKAINKIHSPKVRGVIIKGKVKDSVNKIDNVKVKIIYKLGVHL